MYWVIGAYIVLYFPVFITMLIYYNSVIGKAFFTLTIFGMIKISGYIRLKRETLYFHFSKNRALAVRLINTRQMIKGNVDVFRSIEVFELSAYMNLPLDERSVAVAGAVGFAKSILLPVYKTNKPFITMKNRLTVGKQANAELLFAATIAFNLITIITLILRKLRNSLWMNIKKK